ncbi:hypothetical protein Nepgr_008559 [Nepenthes gracilis]|uniref:Uncharacterized protein n=1 Tax=Nepenthes gracilis TaxID=150966 RepID=A0AAD3XJD8_NEPGR|nr:hypothetical protein Nepgr_008559 [Nepenthes gracilis]
MKVGCDQDQESDTANNFGEDMKINPANIPVQSVEFLQLLAIRRRSSRWCSAQELCRSLAAEVAVQWSSIWKLLTIWKGTVSKDALESAFPICRKIMKS